MLNNQNGLEKFFADNSSSFEIVTQANSIGGGFTF